MSLQNCFLIKEESSYNTMIDFMFKDCDILHYVEAEMSVLTKLLLKRRVQVLLGGFINPVLKKRYGLYSFLRKINNIDTEKKYIIFLNSSFIKSRYPVSVIKYYKKCWPNMRFILLYIDIVSHSVSRHANTLRESGVFDAVYTVDKYDAQKYSMKLTRTPYSCIEIYKDIQICNNLYFCGVTKDRGNTILNLIDCAEDNGVDVHMDVFCSESEKKDFLKKTGVNVLDEYVEYDGLLHKTLKAACILDVVQEGQSAFTLRTYEAVVYNRKLLTNNKAIFEFEYYDPRYMQYFEKPEDINWDWVKEQVNVDYGYKGEFSPEHFVKRIIDDVG